MCKLTIGFLSCLSKSRILCKFVLNEEANINHNHNLIEQ